MLKAITYPVNIKINEEMSVNCEMFWCDYHKQSKLSLGKAVLKCIAILTAHFHAVPHLHAVILHEILMFCLLSRHGILCFTLISITISFIRRKRNELAWLLILLNCSPVDGRDRNTLECLNKWLIYWYKVWFVGYIIWFGIWVTQISDPCLCPIVRAPRS